MVLHLFWAAVAAQKRFKLMIIALVFFKKPKQRIGTANEMKHVTTAIPLGETTKINRRENALQFHFVVTKLLHSNYQYLN